MLICGVKQSVGAFHLFDLRPNSRITTCFKLQPRSITQDASSRPSSTRSKASLICAISKDHNVHMVLQKQLSIFLLPASGMSELQYFSSHMISPTSAQAICVRSVEGRKRIASELIATLSLCSSDAASPSALSLLAADSPVMPLLQLQDRNLALQPGPSGRTDALGAFMYTQGKPVPEKVG